MSNPPNRFALPRCVICLHRCIPLADYDAPVCVACETDVEAILVRAFAPSRAVALTNPPTPLPVALARTTTPRHTAEELTA